jgi:flagellar protein FliL
MATFLTGMLHRVLRAAGQISPSLDRTSPTAMKRSLVSIIILAVVAAAGFAGWMLLGHSSAEAASEAKPAANEPRFVKLDPLVLPVVGNRRVEQVVRLVVALELAEPGKAALVEHDAPKLTDAFITDLYGALEPARLGEGGLVNIDHVKGKLARASNRVLGEGVVKEVLVQMVNQRPLSH